MCLDYVDKKPTVGDGKGWKVFKRQGKHLYGAVIYRGHLRTGVWLGAGIHTVDDKLVAGDGTPYTCGFHVYLREEDAESIAFASRSPNLEPREVEFRNVVATGTQAAMRFPRQVPIVVAKQIKVKRRKPNAKYKAILAGIQHDETYVLEELP